MGEYRGFLKQYDQKSSAQTGVLADKEQRDDGHATVVSEGIIIIVNPSVCAQICFSSAKDNQNSYDNEEGRTMLSVRVYRFPSTITFSILLRLCDKRSWSNTYKITMVALRLVSRRTCSSF